MNATLNMRLAATLPARTDACARAESLRLQEFVRMAIVERCASSQRLAGQRERAPRHADTQGLRGE